MQVPELFFRLKLQLQTSKQQAAGNGPLNLRRKGQLTGNSN